MDGYVSWALLKGPELRELQEDVLRVHGRNDEARQAVEESPLQHVVAQKCRRRVQDHIEDSGATTLLAHLLRRKRRVPVHDLEVVRDVAIGVVLEIVGQVPDAAAGAYGFVDEARRP